jgi:hypothetical protein
MTVDRQGADSWEKEFVSLYVQLVHNTRTVFGTYIVFYIERACTVLCDKLGMKDRTIRSVPSRVHGFHKCSAFLFLLLFQPLLS